MRTFPFSLRFTRIVATIVLITFTTLGLTPTVQALQLHSPTPPPSSPETLNTLLQQLEAELTAWPTLRRGTEPDLEHFKTQLQTLQTQDQNDFQALEVHLRAQRLPDEILQRHQQAVQDHQHTFQTLFKHLETLQTTTRRGERGNESTLPLLQFLKQHVPHPQHAPFDPKHLPFSLATGQVRAPKETPEELQRLFSTSEFSTLASEPSPADLTETKEIQLTEDIRALAKSLNHHPIQIFNWVYDHIRFLPTSGSIQGSALTLETQAGNAVDTASLLIALLRASGIPARYAYGTIQIPVAKAMNWVGGATTPEAALQLLAQGGIPAVALTQGGTIQAVKMEHVWVQAWVDFYPSRGVKNLKGDTWAPMDASYKQYQFTEGMKLSEQVPFEAKPWVEQLMKTATLNETEGWIQGLDSNLLHTALQDYQSRLENYLKQTQADATVGEVLGTQTIIPARRPVLAAGLPYQLVAKGGHFSAVPESLQRSFQLALYADETAKTLNQPTLSFEQSLPSLLGKRLTLSFEPASLADRQVIESFIPKIPEGQTLELSQLPTSLPGYLIKLKAELKVEGKVVVSGGTFTLNAIKLRVFLPLLAKEGVGGWS